MTITYALAAETGIVLAADSERTFTHQGVRESDDAHYVAGTYASKFNKIRILPGYCALSIAGSSGLAQALLADIGSVEIGDSPAFLAYQQKIQDEFLKLYNDDQGEDHPRCDFLLVGYYRQDPYICKLSRDDRFTLNLSDGFGFTGRENHGAALYLHHRLARQNMPLEEAKKLAYLILAEVAEMDNMCGKPIEMVVAKPGIIEKVGQDELNSYEQTRLHIGEALNNAFTEHNSKRPSNL